MTKKFFYGSVGFLALLPVWVFAQTPRKFSDVTNKIESLLTSLLPVLVSIALLVFFWGLIKYIAKSDSPDGREAGKEIMMWGIISLFVMVSIWGIIAFMQAALFNRVLTPARGTEGGAGDGQVFYPDQGSQYPEIP